MKKLFFYAISLVLFCAQIKAQITLDTIVSPSVGIGYDFYTVQISSNETKYYFADTVTNTFSLYNMDFSPFLTNISVPEPFATTTASMQAVYITRTLFDCDSTNIEYAYYSPTNNNKPFRIMRIDGTVLFQLDSALGPFCAGGCLGYSDVIVPIRNTSDGAKLFLNKYDYVNGLQNIYIYSLCDTLHTNIFNMKNLEQPAVSLFPNPSSGLLSFRINLPDNINDYEIVIFDVNKKEIKRENFESQLPLTMDISDWSNGAYFYSLCTQNKIYQSGKFILTK